MSYDEPKLPPASMAKMTLHAQHLPQLRAQLRGEADVLLDGVDKRGIASVCIARYAQPGGLIRKAIKETFG